MHHQFPVSSRLRCIGAWPHGLLFPEAHQETHNMTVHWDVPLNSLIGESPNNHKILDHMSRHSWLMLAATARSAGWYLTTRHVIVRHVLHRGSLIHYIVCQDTPTDRVSVATCSEIFGNWKGLEGKIGSTIQTKISMCSPWHAL